MTILIYKTNYINKQKILNYKTNKKIQSYSNSKQVKIYNLNNNNNYYKFKISKKIISIQIQIINKIYKINLVYNNCKMIYKLKNFKFRKWKVLYKK